MSENITEIRVSRLFSTGQYEHERIEVVVSTPYGIKEPSKTLEIVRDAIEACRPIEMSNAVEFGLKVEKGAVKIVSNESIDPWDDTQCTETTSKEALNALAKHRSLVNERQAKINLLNQFGTVVHTKAT
mgnify:CR=1 FL=1